MGGSSGRVLRVSLGGFLFVGFCWFLLFGVLTNQAIGNKATAHTVTPTRNFGISPSAGGKKHKDSVLNYVSKRRVPNGPDPIHNRRAGNARQPPDRA